MSRLKSVLDSISEILSVNTGKDKTFRMFQYSINFLAELLKEKYKIPNKKYLLIRSVASEFSMARKVIRFTKHPPLQQRMKAKYQKYKESPKLVSLLKILSEIVFMMYLISDHLSYSGKFISINPIISSWCGWLNDFFWFI